MTDYQQAQQFGLTKLPRREQGLAHHPMSIRLMQFLQEHDICDYSGHFSWQLGQDGANGEALMYEMDAFFDILDVLHRFPLLHLLPHKQKT